MRLSPRTTRHSVDGGAPAAGRYLTADDTLLPVMGTVTRLGRSLSADIEIDEPSVSRRHALIVRQDGQTYLLDDGSRNGTWHNGVRVDRAVLQDGDTIDLGTARLSYVEVAETATEDLQLIAA
ncbi:FHA domain-containing protein [Solirubrobacter soli]|uniref:FHA domain-containing protein n=1 Tax=Solirubrobacter soli TaxID=363832 RepID=UPI0003F88AB1|nr:FHA domain-containing protein [Solirubrobacter soli]